MGLQRQPGCWLRSSHSLKECVIAHWSSGPAPKMSGAKPGTEAADYSRFEVRCLRFEGGIGVISRAIQMHKLSRTYPKHELYELGSQLRRAAISIPLNIAEGYGRKTHLKGFRQYLITALGSCNEVTVILEMSKDLGYLDKESYKKVSEAYDHLGRQLNTMVQKWR